MFVGKRNIIKEKLLAKPRVTIGKTVKKVWQTKKT
jgi:hypothetical protein